MNRPLADPNGERRDGSTGLPGAHFESQISQVTHLIDEDEPTPDIVNWFIRGFRGKVKILLAAGFILGALLGTTLFLLASPKYESKAIIRIAATQPFIMYEGNSMASRTFDAFVNSQVGMLSSPGLIEESAKAINEFDPENSISPIGLSQLLRISESKSVIKITATSDDAENAVLYANTLLDNYLEAQRNQVRDRGSYRLRELKNRERELATRLSEKNEETLALGGEYGLDSVVKAHNDKLEVLQNLTRTIEELKRTVLEIETYGTATGAGIADDLLLKELVEDHALDLMLFERSKKLSLLATLELRYQPTSKKVIELKAAVAVLETAMEDRRKQIKALKMSGEIPTDATQRQGRVGELKEKLDKMEPQKEKLEQEARQLHAKTIRLRTLEKESLMLRELLDETQRAVEQVQLESRLDVPGSVELVSRAPLPLQPIKDQRKIFGALGFVFGFASVIGLFLATLIVMPKIRYTDDLDTFDRDAPLIGQLKALNAGPLVGTVDMNVYRLRNNIQLAGIPLLNENRRAKVMAVTSDSERVKSENIASQLATSFSTSGLKTLQINTILEPASVDTETGAAGWREYVVNGDVQTEPNDHGLEVMPLGVSDAITEEQMSLVQIHAAVEKLSQNYDVIIVNIGTLGKNIAADFVVSQCDLTLVVTCPNSAVGPLRRTVSHLKALVPNRVRLMMSEMSSNDPKFSQA